MNIKNPIIDLIIPAYKNRDLLESCVNSIFCNIDEISIYMPRVIIFNNSPDDHAVSNYLSEIKNKYKNDRTEIIVKTNATNLGFIKTVNQALNITRADKRAAILINADTITFPGTLKNLIEAAYSDSQVGFACPRSNNAALATLPHFPHPYSGIITTPEKAHDAWKQISHHLPPLTYSPTATGFYLLIKEKVLHSFYELDEVYGKGYVFLGCFLVGSSRVDLQACKLEYSIVSPK